MSNNIKAMKHMVDETKDDIKEMSTDIANATKEAVEIEAEAKARGIKKGLTE